MIPKEIAKKIRQIQITTNKKVTAVFAGEYSSAFKGQGMEFEEVRSYLPGDEIRSIDWNVTARTGIPHIKRFREERELTMILMVDISASHQFGSGTKTKEELAAEIASVLSTTAIKNNDRVGLILFSDRIELYIPPQKGSRHIFRIIREILVFKPQGRKTSIKTALEFLRQVQKRSAVVFLLSDFQDKGFKRQLAMTAEKHDLISLMLFDPRERILPACGLIRLEDGETGRSRLINSSSRRIREAWTKSFDIRLKEIKRLIGSSGSDCLDISTERDWVHTLSAYFLRRQARQGRM